MAILDRFSAADVILDTGARSKGDLLKRLAAEAASRLGRTSREVLDALAAREDLGSTALGKGAALPHAQLAGLAAPLVLFARLPRPLDFDAPNGDPVDLVFMLLWPAEDPKGLLDAMGSICRGLRDDTYLRRLRHAPTGEDIARLMRAEEASERGRPVVRGE